MDFACCHDHSCTCTCRIQRVGELVIFVFGLSCTSDHSLDREVVDVDDFRGRHFNCSRCTSRIHLYRRRCPADAIRAQADGRRSCRLGGCVILRTPHQGQHYYRLLLFVGLDSMCYLSQFYKSNDWTMTATKRPRSMGKGIQWNSKTKRQVRRHSGLHIRHCIALGGTALRLSLRLKQALFISVGVGQDSTALLVQSSQGGNTTIVYIWLASRPCILIPPLLSCYRGVRGEADCCGYLPKDRGLGKVVTLYWQILLYKAFLPCRR